jgi:hypothetical protein
MKIVNILLALLFASFAAVQFNDPDPLIWIFIYGAVAILCALASFGIYVRGVMIVLLLAYAGYSCLFIDGTMTWLSQEDKSILFDDLSKMQHPYIEEAREFLGLLICLAVLGMHLIRSSKMKIKK